VPHYALDFHEVDRTQIAIVGGKGAHLGELSRIDGIRVPPGFCITTGAFRRLLEEAPSIDDRVDRLSRLPPDDRDAIRELTAEIRQVLEATAIPDDVAAEITRALARLGDVACAVRSSATAEDLPTASFAGQQDTYLDVVGPASILEHVRRCWASLYTERAATYRQKNGFDARRIEMAVVVQQMVFPVAAGILFTADPVTSNRKIASIEAVFGLGEALVSGLVDPDRYHLRDGGAVTRAIGAKKRELGSVLTDAQVVELVALGRRIEAHFGSPQDIEWCLADGQFHFVQSRPITTLFPIPASSDRENHVYLSVGHQQMMTDPMKPLGLSVWQLTTPRRMAEAGGRLFVDVTQALASPVTREGLVGGMEKSDRLMGDALRTVLAREFVRPIPGEEPAASPVWAAPSAIEADPALVTEQIARSRASIAASKRALAGKSGTELLDSILADIDELKRVQFDPQNLRVIMSGMQAAWWLNDKLEAWLGERNAADTLSQSVDNNVTAEMGLALLDVADAIRPHPEVVAFLRNVEGDDFLDELPRLPGGTEARDALRAWLDAYGMRAVGEIDITRPRWSERPSMLLPLLLGNVEHAEPGAGARRFEQGRQEAAEKAADLLERLRALPDGAQKAEETRRMIDRVRAFAGFREYPKYGIVSRYFIYKQALLEEADRLVRAGVLREREDLFFLRFEELRDVLRAGRVDAELIRRRQEEFASYQALSPPRVLTSEGERITGTYRREDLPAGALVGLPVSSGTIEGRARVVVDVAEAALEPGDILVTVFTDPSWTPLFVAIAGLVTEVGGLMTHGAVIAREYGLPAVVGVEHATRLVRDGQRIRVNGTDGYVEILA
jgi:pyruvate,water dikinase